MPLVVKVVEVVTTLGTDPRTNIGKDPETKKMEAGTKKMEAGTKKRTKMNGDVVDSCDEVCRTKPNSKGGPT